MVVEYIQTYPVHYDYDTVTDQLTDKENNVWHLTTYFN